MSLQGAYTFSSPVASGDVTKPIALRDALLTGAGGGVKAIFDLAFPWCYPGGAYAGRPAAGAPANAAVVRDVAEIGDGSFLLQAGEVVSYAGGGFDFSAVTKIGSFLQGSGLAATSIHGSVNQYFLVCAYMKLPLLADWNVNPGLTEMIKFAAGNTNYQTAPELVTIAQQLAGVISARRQTAAGVAGTNIAIVPAAADYGSVVQIAFWRDATGNYLRLKSANGIVITNVAVGVNNTQDFSALPVKIGAVAGFAGNSGIAYLPGQTGNMKMRMYRAFVENLAVSGRDATTVINADYARVIARNAFS